MTCLCFQENKIKVDNIEINCLQTGNGYHKVFLLPGLVGNCNVLCIILFLLQFLIVECIAGTFWTDFSPQITGFDPNEYTVIAWDPPGYGKSRPPQKDFSDGFYERDADMAVKLLKVP